MSLYEVISNLFSLLRLILIIRILLTWFPNINWWNQPFKLIKDITDPILDPFRRMIPPVGGLDLSPLILFMFVLPLLEWAILKFITI